MRCQNITDNNRRCKRSADKIIIVKDITTNVKEQSKFWICDECFYEKMYSDQLFKNNLIQVTELNRNRRIDFQYY